MAPRYREGQTVRYKPLGGPDSRTSESVGIIQKVFTSPELKDGRSMKASVDSPRYEIENCRTGKVTAIYERNIFEREGGCP